MSSVLERSSCTGFAGDIGIQEVGEVVNAGCAVGRAVVAGVIGVVVIGVGVANGDRVAGSGSKVLEGTS